MKRRLADTENPTKQRKSKHSQQQDASVNRAWTEEENEYLKTLTNLHHGKNWDAIALALSKAGFTKSARQCRERWHNHLDPSIKEEPLTKEENTRLIELHKKFGNKWSVISSMMAGRTDNAIKNAFFCKLRKFVRCLKYGVESLELDKSDVDLDEACYFLDYLFKFYISPDHKKNLQQILTPQIQSRQNKGDKYVIHLLKNEGLSVEKFNHFVKDLLAMLCPQEVWKIRKLYPYFGNISTSETENSFSGCSYHYPKLASSIPQSPQRIIDLFPSYKELTNCSYIVESTASGKDQLLPSISPPSAEILARTLPVPRIFYPVSQGPNDFVPTFYFPLYSPSCMDYF